MARPAGLAVFHKRVARLKELTGSKDVASLRRFYSKLDSAKKSDEFWDGLGKDGRSPGVRGLLTEFGQFAKNEPRFEHENGQQSRGPRRQIKKRSGNSGRRKFNDFKVAMSVLVGVRELAGQLGGMDRLKEFVEVLAE